MKATENANQINIRKNCIVIVNEGDYFDLMLPDGTVLNVEQTADDFTITMTDGHVAYSQATRGD